MRGETARRLRYVKGVCLGIISFFTLLLLLVFLPMHGGPAGPPVRIPQNASAKEVVALLTLQGIVKTPNVLYPLIRFAPGTSGIKAGVYDLHGRESAYGLARRLLTGDTGIPETKITFPEGETVADMTLRIEEVFSKELAQSFYEEARQYEGYLFPDTYYFSVYVSSGDIVSRMKDVFELRTTALSTEAKEKSRSFSDIVIIASLIEKETNTAEDRRIVSGILARRLSLNMPLQVDAVFGYIHQKRGYEPTREDLKIDSPYNTYRYRGLPPGPIANPGLNSLKAALEPAETPYLFYLTGRDGAMHYARTFEEHKQNRARYLD